MFFYDSGFGEAPVLKKYEGGRLGCPVVLPGEPVLYMTSLFILYGGVRELEQGKPGHRVNTTHHHGVVVSRI